MFDCKRKVAAMLALVAGLLNMSPSGLAQEKTKPENQRDKLSVAEFEKLHKELTRHELWYSIPWKTSIREARELAVKEKKPIAFWYVQGNVLSLC